MSLDITAFCVKLERVAYDRVRLTLFCAPPWGGDLARALARFGARKKSASSAVIRQPKMILAAAEELGLDEEVRAALVRYVAAWSLGRMGRQVQPHVQEERRAAVKGIPGLYWPSEGSE